MLTNFREEIDECGGHVVSVIAQFGGFVVPREHVVIIMPAFAQSHNGANWTVRWTNGSVRGRRNRRRMVAIKHVEMVGKLFFVWTHSCTHLSYGLVPE